MARKQYRGKFSKLPPERQHKLRSQWAKKAAKTRKINQEFYNMLLKEAGLLQYFKAPKDRGGRDFAFDLDPVTGIRKARTPIFDAKAHSQATDVIGSVKGKRVRVRATFVWQGPDGKDHYIRGAKSDPFTVVSDDDISEAYYELAGEVASELYDKEGDEGQLSFSVSEIEIDTDLSMDVMSGEQPEGPHFFGEFEGDE